MTGLVKLDTGHVRICGRPVQPAAKAGVAHYVGFVFQNADHQFVSDTVWSEALFTPNNLRRADPSINRRATQWLAAAGLADRLAAHPYRLSWGQKRRLNLISSLLHDPRLVLLDEPFAGQDGESLILLLDAIRTVVGSAADESELSETALSPPRGSCVIVTHDPRIITGWATRIVFVDAGRVVVDAPVADAIVRLGDLGFGAYVTGTHNALPRSIDRTGVRCARHGPMTSTEAD